jgi:hypothetical protein
VERRQDRGRDWQRARRHHAVGGAWQSVSFAAGRGRSSTSALPSPHDAPARRRAGKAPPQPAQIKARRNTLLDLTNECCRWPYGEHGGKRFFFCGAAGADIARGIPYCPRHMERAYIVPPTLVKPLHRIIAPAAVKLAAAVGSGTRSFRRPRESTMRKFG